MATIIEKNTRFTLTKEAALELVVQGLLFECKSGHKDTLEVDRPVYHIASTAPEWVGFNTLSRIIETAEKAIEDDGNR